MWCHELKCLAMTVCWWNSLLGLFGVNRLGCQPSIYIGLYIFAGRVPFTKNQFCVLSKIGTVAIIEILGDDYAAKIKITTLTSKHWFLTFLSTCVGSMCWCSAQSPVAKGVLQLHWGIWNCLCCLVIAILYYVMPLFYVSNCRGWGGGASKLCEERCFQNIFHIIGLCIGAKRLLPPTESLSVTLTFGQVSAPRNAAYLWCYAPTSK